MEDFSNTTSDVEESNDDFAFVLSSQPKTQPHHPPPERIQLLWQIFIENVDPLTKVVHVPTLRPAISKAIADIERIPRSFEALMFAIYSAAVMSMKEEDCEQRLGEPREILLLQYISDTEAALARAKFMGTVNFVVLQALVLHLFCIRDVYEPRAVWSLTGVAIRIAQSMGLERDGVLLGLPPFEIEMRRRLWWLLKSHDFRTAELCGLAKFRDLDMGAESTKSPTNFNDDQLYPGMPSLVVTESNRLTDAVFVALKYEFTKFAAGRIARFRQQGKTSSDWGLHTSGRDKAEINEAFKEVEEMIETKYLRYCDPSQPLHLATMLAARYFINTVHFLIHHPRRWASIEQTPLSDRQWIWEISIKLLQQHNMLQSNPQLKQFAWHSAYFQRWDAFIHVLDTLRANPLIADAEKAWQIISVAYENNPDMIFPMKKLIHIAIGNLCLKAHSAREAALKSGNICPPQTPGFISQLRQQRKVAMAKKQVRDAKSSQLKVPVSKGQANAQDIISRQDFGFAYLSNTLDSTSLQQSSLTLNPTQTGSTNEGDPFWFTNGIDHSQGGNFDDIMNLDQDFMLGQASNEGNATQTINWEQWDAWLA